MLQGVAQKRGRPFLLSVRVADTVPGCHFDGFDIESWVEQNLVDMIIIGTRSVQVDLAGFKQVVRDRHVKLYPCIDQHHSPDGYHAVPAPEFLRGVAANWWHQGADGIATFNFWNELPDAAKRIGSSGPLANGQSVHAQAYREIGDPAQLASLDKWFVVARRFGGGFYDRLGNRWNDFTNLNHLAPLPQVLGADPAWVDLYVADDLHDRAAAIERLELRLLFSPQVDAQRVRVRGKQDQRRAGDDKPGADFLTFDDVATLQLEPDPTHPGIYRALTPPLKAGTYEIAVAESPSAPRSEARLSLHVSDLGNPEWRTMLPPSRSVTTDAPVAACAFSQDGKTVAFALWHGLSSALYALATVAVLALLWRELRGPRAVNPAG